MGIQGRWRYRQYDPGTTNGENRLTKQVVGMTMIILISVMCARARARPDLGYTTVVVEYVGKQDHSIFPIIISTSSKEAEWYSHKLYDHPFDRSMFVDIYTVKQETLKEISDILLAKVDFNRPISTSGPVTAPTLILVMARGHDSKETEISAEDSAVILSNMKKRVLNYPPLVDNLTKVEVAMKLGGKKVEKGEKGVRGKDVRYWTAPQN